MKKIFLSIGILCLLLCGCRRSNVPHVTITFNAEQGYFETPTMKKYYVTIAKGSLFYEATQEVPVPVSLLDSYAFDSWAKDESGVPENLVLDSDMEVTAKYHYLEPITITYDLNGGSYGGEVNPISLKNHKDVIWSKAAKLADDEIEPPNNLLEFEAWSLSKDKLESISIEHVFNGSTTLYAYYRPVYLTFTALEEKSTISYSSNSVDTTGLEYSKDGSVWYPWVHAEILELALNESIYVRNKNSALSTSSNIFNFKMTGLIGSSGNVNSLINFSALSDACFYRLFRNCKSLQSAPSLPSLTLAPRCYREMFQYCSSLVSAPSLPALSVPAHAYQSMFQYCSSLERGPIDLPATDLPTNYSFECYRTMFGGCSKLRTAPIIYARSIGRDSFVAMFALCSELSYIKTYYTGSFNSSFLNWVKEVSPIGHIYYGGLVLNRGISSIPENWTVEPRIGLKAFLTNCSCEPETVDYYNGETVDLTLTPDTGYVLPDDVVTNAKVFRYNKEKSVFSFLGEDKVIMLRVDAIKV